MYSLFIPLTKYYKYAKRKSLDYFLTICLLQFVIVPFITYAEETL